jgi:hypothetical protein
MELFAAAATRHAATSADNGEGRRCCMFFSRDAERMRCKKEAVLPFDWNDDHLPEMVREYHEKYKEIGRILDENPGKLVSTCLDQPQDARFLEPVWHGTQHPAMISRSSMLKCS